MDTELWHIIITVGQRARQLLSEDAAPGAAPAVIGPVALGRLHDALREALDQARAALLRRLPEQDAGMVLLPLTIATDEMVTGRLAREDQVRWPLLQKEIFGVQDGGDIFFTFLEERLQRQDTPPFVHAVLYYLLLDGFTGRYVGDPARLERYRAQLGERVPRPELPRAPKRRRREQGAAEVLAATAPRPVPAAVFYVLAISSAILLLFALVTLTNL